MAVAFGRYQLMRRLATGGMGEIFLARSAGAAGFEKLVVIKRVLPRLARNQEFLQLFLAEARIAAGLNHPNIAQIFELGQEGNDWFLTMEYVAGHDLQRVLYRARSEGKPIPLGARLRVIADAAAGLDHAHRATDGEGRPLGIVHRDVSPHNVLVGFDGGVKLIDFGVAKATHLIEPHRPALLRGKAPYMSPEQATGQPVDARSDVFSLGAVLWETLTGRRLFRGDSDREVLRQIVEGTVPPPSSLNPEVSGSLDALTLRALERSPKDRYGDAGALRFALEELMLSEQLASSSAHLETSLRALYGGPPPLTDELTSAELSVDVPPLPAGVAEPERTQRGDSHSMRTLPLLPERVARKTNLPPERGPFFGRARELALLDAWAARGERVLCLHGPAGAGKTRLAIQHARARAGELAAAGGTWLCDLTEARSTDDACAALSHALEIPLPLGRTTDDAIRQLGHALGARGELLVVLDEGASGTHLDGALPRWLALAPSARFVWISRTAPPEHAACSLHVEGLGAEAGLQLLAPSPAEAKAAPRVVAALKGLPLALEVVRGAGEPARARVLQAEASLLKLDAQGALDAAVGFTLDLLPAGARAALAQASVFRGGFSLEAFERVVSFAGSPEHPAAGDALGVLEAHGLVQARPDVRTGRARYWLHERIRALAARELTAAGEQVATEERHAEFFLDEQLERDVRGWLAAERDNLWVIAERSFAAPQTFTTGLLAVLVLDPLLSQYGPAGAYLGLLDSALTKVESGKVEPLFLARTLESRGRARQARRRLSEALADFEQALKLVKANPDLRLEGRIEGEIGAVFRLQGRVDDARRRLARALEALREAGDRRGEARVLRELALVERGSSVEQAHGLLLRAIALHRQSGDRRYEAYSLRDLGECERDLGHVDKAQSALHRSLSLAADLGESRAEAAALESLASVSRDLGQLDQATAYFETALSLHREAGERRQEAVVLGQLAGIDFELSDAAQAREKYQRALELLREVGDRRQEGLVLGGLGALLAAQKQIPAAKSALAEAEALLTVAGDVSLLSAVTLYRGHLELALAHQAAVAGHAEEADALRESVRRRIARVSKGQTAAVMLGSGEHIRAALRLLRKAL